MSVQAVIDTARADLGYTEYPPNSNKTKFGEWYGMNGQPWCVMALAYWFDKAGERTAFFAGAKTPSCTTLGRWYKAQGATVPLTDIRAGDIVLLNFHGGLSAEHCGLVTEVLVFGLVKTIEGNTSPGEEGSQDNGGCVAAKTRTAAQIVQVCRPMYKEEPMPKSDYEKHWAREDIDWCIDRGLLTGYPDGTFQPDKPVTRAEMAVIIRRICDYCLQLTTKVGN